jgi:hypothetical protein
VSGLGSKHSAHVALVDEAHVVGEPPEVTLSTGEPLEGSSRAKADPVTSDCPSGVTTEYPAQMMWRDSEITTEFRQ